MVLGMYLVAFKSIRAAMNFCCANNLKNDLSFNARTYSRMQQLHEGVQERKQGTWQRDGEKERYSVCWKAGSDRDKLGVCDGVRSSKI